MNQDKKKNGFNPHIDVSDDGRHHCLLIRLPGVAEEQIRLDLEDATLILTISEEGLTRTKTIRIPQGVRLFKKKFSNGELEIMLDRPRS